MRFKFILSCLALVCSSLLAVDGVFAQQCRSQLINGTGVIIESFSGTECRSVRKYCRKKLRRLKAQSPRFYRNAYCNVTETQHYVSPRPIPHSRMQPYVSPYTHPRAYVSPHSRTQPYVSPYTQPRTYVSPHSRSQPYVSPYTQPRTYVSPYSRTRSYVSPGSRPIRQPVPQSHVTRSYDRCQGAGIVRCTQEWSDGRVVIEDHSCSGCRAYSNPSGDPCGWMCSFPQQ